MNLEKKSNEKQTKTIASVEKAIEVIEYIAYSKKELGVTEISNGLNYGASGTYHLLNTLKQCNILVQDEATKKYSLGLKLWKIGMLSYGKNHISSILRPYLRKLKDLTGETTNLTILDNDHIVYIAQEASDKLVKMFTTTGAMAPIHCTAAGKVLLAYKDEEEREDILDSIKFDRFTESTLVSKEEILEEIEEIKILGYGFDNEEREIGVSCIAAPIFDLHGEALACITISGPTARFNEENKSIWGKIILEVAEEANEYLKTVS